MQDVGETGEIAGIGRIEPGQRPLDFRDTVDGRGVLLGQAEPFQERHASVSLNLALTFVVGVYQLRKRLRGADARNPAPFFIIVNGIELAKAPAAGAGCARWRTRHEGPQIRRTSMAGGKVLSFGLAVLVAGPILANDRWSSDHDRRDRRIEARLTGYEETPSTLSTTGRGSFKAVVTKDDEIVYELKYANLESDITQSHIHFGRPGLSGGIAAWLCGTPANPGPTGNLPPQCELGHRRHRHRNDYGRPGHRARRSGHCGRRVRGAARRGSRRRHLRQRPHDVAADWRDSRTRTLTTRINREARRSPRRSRASLASRPSSSSPAGSRFRL